MICICGATFDPPARKCGEAKRHCSMRCKTRAWRAENPARAAAVDAAQDDRRRLKNTAHPELSKACEKARYAADPARHRRRVAAYRSDPEVRARSNAVSRAWRAANPEKNHAAIRRWASAHPESTAHHQAAWRARKRGNGGSHTLTEWRDKCASFRDCCAYCGEGKRLSRDHDIPLSLGGTDDIANIVPACLSCNSRKHTSTAAAFLEQIA